VPELVILEFLAGFFLLLPLLRPLVRNWRPLDGLPCLPPLALLILIGIFPAYGFRPECLPLLIYAAARNIRNLSGLRAVLSRSGASGPRGGGRAGAYLSLLILAASLGAALIFVPRSETRLTETLTLQAGAQGELFVRVYPPPEGEAAAPVLLVAPPVLGSVPAVDLLCGALAGAGFRVFAWSRRGFDVPSVNPAGKKRFPPLKQQFAVYRAALAGHAYAGANLAARALEEGRRRDAETLLGYLAGEFPDAPVFALGFGAGGAALLALSGDPERFPALRGIIAVESPPRSALLAEAYVPPEPREGASWLRSVWEGFRNALRSLRPRRITGMEALPQLRLPVCLILSGRVRDPAYRDTRYAALIRGFHAAGAPSVLLSLRGAGILDYSDIPGKYPLACLPFRGGAFPAPQSASLIPQTTALIRRFVSALMEEEAGGAAGVRGVSPRLGGLGGIEPPNGGSGRPRRAAGPRRLERRGLGPLFTYPSFFIPYRFAAGIDRFTSS
jgi:dienelactone hydrolase